MLKERRKTHGSRGVSIKMANEIFGGNDEREKALLDKFKELLDLRCDLIIDIITDRLEEINDKLDTIAGQNSKPEPAVAKSKKRAILRIRLSPMETFVLDMLALNMTDKEIAAAIDSSGDGVKNVIVRILKKLEAANRAYFEGNTAMLHAVKYEEMPDDDDNWKDLLP